MNEPKCHECRFWVSDGKSSMGACRRYPPTMIADIHEKEEWPATVAVWPQIGDEEWCGEFQPTLENALKALSEINSKS